MSTMPMSCPSPRSAKLREYQDRVAALRPELATGTPAFDAAVLLLSLREVPPNVDRLANRLRLQRTFVARCMRRLFDNGVLAGERLVALWAEEEFDARAFWADVNVALGKWWRRSDGRGRLHWVPAGVWRKDYDFVTSAQTESTLHAVYHAHADAGAETEEGLSLRMAGRRSVWIGSLVGGAAGWEAERAAALSDPPQHESEKREFLIGLPLECLADANPTIWLC